MRRSGACAGGVLGRSRKCAAAWRPGSGAGLWRAFARGGARCGLAGALEPPASVAEAVSSLTIADAFVEAGESPGPAPSAPTPPRRFICSFPDCSAGYNKAWKLEAHLCKHTGEVGLGGPVRRAEASLQVVSAGAPLDCWKIPS